MPTGDDLVAGEGRSANATTAVLASLESGDPANGFFGPTRPVLVAGPTDDRPNVPFAVFDGIHGSGSDPLRAGDNAFHEPGSGVVGFGGKSAGDFGPAQGGSGIVGFGGNANLAIADRPALGPPPYGPGIGVIGIGGFSDDGTMTTANGAGVVGISSGRVLTRADGVGVDRDTNDLQWLYPPGEQAGNVGVFGRGSDAGFTTTAGFTPEDTTGTPGPGIVGLGGRQFQYTPAPTASDPANVDKTATGSVAAGVVGVAGDADASLIVPKAATEPAGVIGAGQSGPGVLGTSASDGVIGASLTVGRGVVCRATRGAALRLDPLHLPDPNGNILGAPGDLLTTVPAQRPDTYHLWFCNQSDAVLNPDGSIKKNGTLAGTTWVKII
jgi:hypothetical protein